MLRLSSVMQMEVQVRVDATPVVCHAGGGTSARYARRVSCRWKDKCALRPSYVMQVQVKYGRRCYAHHMMQVQVKDGHRCYTHCMSCRRR